MIDLIKKTFKNLKKMYFKIFFMIMPFIIAGYFFLCSIFYFYIDFMTNPFFKFGFGIICTIINNSIFIIGLYAIKNMDLPGNIVKNSYLEITTDFFIFLKIILKKIIIVNIGLICFFIPGLILIIRWYFVYPIFIFEKESDAFTKSKKFIKNHLDLAIIIIICYWLLFIIAMIFGGSTGLLYKQFFLQAAPSYIKFLGVTLFYLLILPIAIIFDYEFYKYRKNNYNEYDDIVLKPLKI